MDAQIISADKIKKDLPGYDPKLAEEYHHESAQLADIELKRALKDNPNRKVILMSGGSASGKTEFMLTQLVQRDAIIFDTTLSTGEGARIKIKNIRKSGRKLEVYAVIPDDLSRAFIAFLHRDRKFSDAHFYQTHSGSRSTLLNIAINHPDIPIYIIESSYTEDKHMRFAQVTFDNHDQFIKYLETIQVSENAIIDLVSREL
ncbi:MAG: hypothetical protein WCL07_03475 [bacterium]